VFRNFNFGKTALLFVVMVIVFMAGHVSKIVFVAASVATTADWSVESDQANAQLGRAVGFAGDVNGDGHLDVFIGAPYFDNGQSNEGRVLVYYGAPDGLSSEANWTKESDQADANFGAAVSAAGDVNGDGFDDLIIGAPNWDESPNNDIGKVFVFHGSSSGLAASPTWTKLGENAGDKFGGSVGSAGDVNNDVYSEILIGSQRFDNGQTDEGKVYSFYGSSSGLSNTADWSYESGYTEMLLGTSVSTAGDVNNDGYDDVVVGGQGLGQYDVGMGLAFYGSSSGLSSSPNRIYWGEQGGSKFGFAVSKAGDVNNDGYGDVVIGSFGYGNDSQGRTYVYHGSSTGLSSVADWTITGTTSTSELGFSVGYAGDVNYDGYDDIILSEPKINTASFSQAGKAHIFTGSSSGLNSVAYWTKEGGSNGEAFGFSVNSAGSILDETVFRVIVGAPSFDNGQSNEGGAFIYYSRCD
jgi:hypothetical protein